MLSEADEKLLLETCRICYDSIWQIQVVLSKIEDEDLSDDLNRQMGRYIRMINRANKKLQQNGKKSYENKMIDRMKKWSKIQRDTLLNNSTKHIADMLIQDNTKGIAYMLKAMHDYPKCECSEFAEELVEFEEQSISQLKYYLGQNG